MVRIRMSIVYPAVVVSLLAVDSSLLDSASAGNRARLPRTDDPPIWFVQCHSATISISLFHFILFHFISVFSFFIFVFCFFVFCSSSKHNRGSESRLQEKSTRQYFKWDKAKVAQPKLPSHHINTVKDDPSPVDNTLIQFNYKSIISYRNRSNLE